MLLATAFSGLSLAMTMTSSFLALGSELFLEHTGSQAGPVAGAFPPQLQGGKEDSVSQQGGQGPVS